MTKIQDIKSEIEDLEIIIDKTIIIQVLNFLNTFFAYFLGILSHEAKKKNKLSIFENLTKFLKDKELQIKNQDEKTLNYAK